MPTETADVVLVLANLMDDKGEINKESRSRIEVGMRARRLCGGYMFFIGWPYRVDCGVAIADAMRRYQACRMFVPRPLCIMERRSRDTVGDAIFSKIELDRMFRRYRLTVISSDYHLKRVQIIFRRVYGKSVVIRFLSAPSQSPKSTKISEARSLNAFRETFRGVPDNSLPQLVRRMKEAHPLYNGKLLEKPRLRGRLQSFARDRSVRD